MEQKKTLQHPGRRNLEEFVFDAFMPVFCVLTMEIMEGVVSYVTDEVGSGARGISRRICL
jgi:hypothetical protein